MSGKDHPLWEQAGQDMCRVGKLDIDHEGSFDAVQISSAEGTKGAKGPSGKPESNFCQTIGNCGTKFL